MTLTFYFIARSRISQRKQSRAQIISTFEKTKSLQMEVNNNVVNTIGHNNKKHSVHSSNYQPPHNGMGPTEPISQPQKPPALAITAKPRQQANARERFRTHRYVYPMLKQKRKKNTALNCVKNCFFQSIYIV